MKSIKDKNKNKLRKKSTRKKKKTLAFTLIELLAVIIILGVLMLVAIPSVTSYIANSRKEAYIDTVKNLIKGATNLVNSGTLDVFDTETTYYIPNSCIELETGGDSPYGKFDPAYIMVTYNNDSFDYYWMSRDSSGQGIKNVTNSKDLNSKIIEAGIKKEDINTKTSIGDRDKIIEFNEDCSSIKETRSPDKYVQEDNPSEEISFSRIKQFANNTVFGKSMSRYYIEKVYTLKSIDIPANAIDSWDISDAQDESIMAWYTDIDNNSRYELYLGQKGGVRANQNCSNLFSIYTQATYLDMSNFITNDVTNMDNMFEQTGYTGDRSRPFKIVGLNNWNVSKVESMKNMFQYAGRSAESWDIGDLSGWNTSSVKSMNKLFYFTAYNAKRVELNLANWNVSNVIDMGQMFTAFGQFAEYWSIGNLSNWDTRNVSTMDSMFCYAGQRATTWNSIGTLKVYATNISNLMSICENAHATINIYSNPTNFGNAFGGSTATKSGSSVVVNYSRNTQYIDPIIATKSQGANVTKGSQLD